MKRKDNSLTPFMTLAAGSLVLTGILASCIGKTSEVDCVPYQSYGDDQNGRIIYVFDERPFEEREGEMPEYALAGDPEMYKKLEIGSEYRLKIKNYEFYGLPRLVSFEPCNQGEVRNYDL